MAPSVRTMLFSDVEGSTELLQRAGNRYPELLGRHQQIIRRAIAESGGTEHSTEGDSFFVTFETPSAAVSAAVLAQLGLAAADWPTGLNFRVRMGLHVGEIAATDAGLVGLAIHECARIANSAHGGQIVVSDAVRSLAGALPVGTSLRPLGPHRLRDVGLVPLFQVEHPELQSHFPELRGVVGRTTNLPQPSSNYVGGDETIASLADAVHRGRLITLTGTGGVGKTRTAIEYAWRHLADFKDGGLFVDLAPIADAGAVPAAVLTTMPVIADGGTSLVEAIVDWLANRRVLLILDNCEHLVGEVCAVVNEVVSGCANTTVLATSREALGVSGERVLRVPSLDPAGDAVVLFRDRAIASDPSFASVEQDQVLTDICTRLDGIPLAIELAAARMRSMSPEELLVRLQDRFRLLRGSGRGTLDRHQTLRATVSWSYQLLTAEQRLLFDRVAIFAGGFDLAAAEAVCGFEPLVELDVIDLVDSLVDKSMVLSRRDASGHTRYRLLETMRQFGEEQLEVRGETSMVRDRQARHYADVVAELDTGARSAEQNVANAEMSEVWDNLRAAHLWALATEDLELAHRLIRNSHFHAAEWIRHEHAEWTARTIELADRLGRPSTQLFSIYASWKNYQGDDEAMLQLARRGVAVAPAPDDPVTVYCWTALCGASPLVASDSADVIEAFHCLEAAVANVADIDRDWDAMVDLVDSATSVDPARATVHLRHLREIAARVKAPLLLTYVSFFDGHQCLMSDPPDYSLAATHYQRAAEIAREFAQVRCEGMALRGLAMTATGLRSEDALDRCRDAMVALYDLRYWQKLWQTLDSVTLALAQAGRTDEASLVVEHLDATIPPCGLELDLRYREKARALIAAAPPRLGQRGPTTTWSRDELVARALEFCSPPSLTPEPAREAGPHSV